MQVALMVPCYVAMFYPEIGVAALELHEKLKVDVVYPFDQTCCGFQGFVLYSRRSGLHVSR
jgi:L-lactate dehydrogenase complex protein LldE